MLLITAGFAAEPAAEKPRGLWFWSRPASPHGAANVVGVTAPEEEALAVFRRWNIRRLYGSYGTTPLERPDIVAHWNRRLHAQGIRSESLFSDPGALTPAGRVAFLQQIEARVLGFNRARSDAAERFMGVALDIEPHATTRWKGATPETKRVMLEELLVTCSALREHLDAHGGTELTISAALAYWLDRLPPAGSVGWRSAADRDDWFGRLARCVTSISLMAYERSREELILDATAWERENFRGRTVAALRVRGHEWSSLADLVRVIPAIEAAHAVGIDLENYENLVLAEKNAGSR